MPTSIAERQNLGRLRTALPLRAASAKTSLPELGRAAWDGAGPGHKSDLIITSAAFQPAHGALSISKHSLAECRFPRIKGWNKESGRIRGVDIDEFSDGEWREIYEELRLLVQRAGYADWDMAMAESLAADDPEDRVAASAEFGVRPANYELRRYTEEFMRYLKSRSRWTLDERQKSLGNILHTADGQPVENFSVIFGERERSLYERTEDIEKMIDQLSRFHAEISGENTSFWFNAPQDPDGGAAR